MTAKQGMPLRVLFGPYEVKKLRGKACGTTAQYFTAISHFEDFLQRDATTDDLFDERVTSWMFALTEHRGIEVVTAVSYVKKILALWRFACRQRIIDRPEPEIELLKIPDREPLAWTRTEIEILFRAIYTQEGIIGGVPASLFWPALLCTFWDSAERLGAVLMIRVEDLNLAAKWCLCRAETRKGKLRDRGFPLHDQTAEFLRLMLEAAPKRRLVFECPFGEHSLRDRYKTILKAAGLPHDRRRLFHCLRKSVASHFEAIGFNAMELLDHTSREVTKRYLAPQIVRQPQPADVLWRPGQPELTLRE